MTSRLRTASIIVTLAVAPGCSLLRSFAYPSAGDIKAKTLGLAKDMSEGEVTNVLGVPDEKEGSLCGDATCTVWTYRTTDRHQTLRVTFRPDAQRDLWLAQWGW